MRRELIALAEEDLRVRSELASDGSLFGGYHPTMRAVHEANAARLTAILEQQGWPGERQVGTDGAEAAWLIVQHAVGNPVLQRRALAALRSAVERGEAAAVHAAMLEDRIRTLEGRPQRYGTQFDWDARGELSPLPVELPDRVDERRRDIGLGPLAQAMAAHGDAAARWGARPPEDWRAYQARMQAWRREAGWLD